MNGKLVEYDKEKGDQLERNPANYRCSVCSKDAVTFIDSKAVCQAHSVIEPVAQGLFQSQKLVDSIISTL
jgi:hypothetical protein